MGNRRFSTTTAVLVGISLVALYYVGKTVTPPPPAPPQEKAAPAAPVAPSAPPPKAAAEPPMPHMNQSESETYAAKQRAEKMQAMIKATQKSSPPKKTFSATSMDTEADYWQYAKDGKKGTAELRAKVAKALAEHPQGANVPVKQKASPIIPGP